MDSVDVTESEPQPEPESNPTNPFGDNDASPVHEVVDKVGILSLDAEIKEELNRKVQYGSSLTITVDDPKEEGGKLNSYVSYCVTVRPALPGVSYVRRRFSDFEWLRDVLTASFPGVFIPPLPPKKLIGKDQEFIKERTHNLERFINRVAAIPFCAATEVFQNFLSRHESSFEGLKKELEKKIKASPSGELLRSYSDLFPHAFNTPLPDDADESMLRLHSFLEKQEAELTPMVKAAEALVQHSEEAVKDAQQIHTFASHLDKLEADYPQRPSPARTNVLPHMERWTQTLKSSASSFKAHLADSYRYELEDIQAMLEVVKARDELKKAADKAHARAEKWRAPGVVATAKQTQQKDEDMAQEEATRFAVDVVTKVVLLDQLPHVWEEKMGSFRSTIKALARDYLETAKVIASTWENLANLDD